MDEEYAVLARTGGAYMQVWRGVASDWFAALESVPAASRASDMFVVRTNDVHFVQLMDIDPTLPDTELVRVLQDGSLRRTISTDQGVV